VVRALFDNDEVVDSAESFPKLRELRGEQFAEEWADADIGKIIAASSDRCAIARVIAVVGVIERLFHEPGERLGTALPDFIANKLDQFGLDQKTSNAKRRTSNAEVGEC
jgi:hypothetical protein